MFLYLDRAYVVSHPGTLTVFQLGLRQLRSQLEALPHVSGGAHWLGWLDWDGMGSLKAAWT